MYKRLPNLNFMLVMFLLTPHTTYEWGSLVKGGRSVDASESHGGVVSGGSSLPPQPRVLDDVRTTSPPEGPRGAWQEGKGSPRTLQPP